MSILLDDCVKLLGEEAIILSQEEKKSVFHQLTAMFSFTRWARIDWSQVEQNIEVTSVTDILPVFRDKGKKMPNGVFIMWDEAKLPVLKSNIHQVLRYIEEVTMVSFDTWIFCPEEKFVIEFYHEGEITIGFKE